MLLLVATLGGGNLLPPLLGLWWEVDAGLRHPRPKSRPPPPLAVPLPSPSPRSTRRPSRAIALWGSSRPTPSVRGMLARRWGSTMGRRWRVGGYVVGGPAAGGAGRSMAVAGWVAWGRILKEVVIASLGDESTPDVDVGAAAVVRARSRVGRTVGLVVGLGYFCRRHHGAVVTPHPRPSSSPDPLSGADGRPLLSTLRK